MKILRYIRIFNGTLILTLGLMFMTMNNTTAQCPMCKLSAETNLRDGGSAGKGLNTGILYMFAVPYLLVGSLAFLWYKNRKNLDNNDSTN